MGVNSLPKTVTRQRRGCDLNSGPSAPKSSSGFMTHVTCRLTARTGISSGTLRLPIEYGLPLPFC